MTAFIVAAIGVLVGWFGRPRWFRFVHWLEDRRNAREWAERGASPATVASIDRVLKHVYEPNLAETLAARPVMRFSDARKFHIVGAIDGGHAVTYPEAAAEVEAAVAKAHEDLVKAAFAPPPDEAA